MAIFIRILISIVGGYMLSALSVQLLALGLTRAGMLRSEAVVLSAMFAFILYLLVLLWAFAERRIWRIILILGLVPVVVYLLVSYLIP